MNNFLKRCLWSLALMVGLGFSGAAYSQDQGSSVSSTNGPVCTSNGVGTVMPTYSFSPNNTPYIANPAKNSPGNPIFTVTVSGSLTGCTLTLVTSGSTSPLYLYVPGNTSSPTALLSPLQGISYEITATSFTITPSGAGSANCSAGSPGPAKGTGGGVTLFYILPNANFSGPGNVFTNCTLNYSYTLVFFTNSSVSAANGTGTFTSALFNSLGFSSGTYHFMDWGQIRAGQQGGGYSYQFSGPSFNIAYESCTPSVSIGGSANATITLPTVSSSQLNGAGKTAGSTPFSIALNNCASTGSNYSASATWTYTAFSSSFPNVIANIFGSSAASGVGVQISETTTGNPVLANGAMGATTWTINSSSNSAPAQTFNAYYYSTGTTNLAGGVQGMANYTMSYN